MLQPIFKELRRHISPRAGILARGEARPARASDIIFGMTLMMLLVVMLARAITHLFTAA